MTEIQRLPVNRDGKLVIGIVCGGTWDAWFGTAMVNVLTAFADTNFPLKEVIVVRGGPALQLLRGVIVGNFLDHTEGEALLMLDSDMYFTPQTIADHWTYFNTPVQGGQQVDILGGLTFISGAPIIGPKGSIQPNVWAPHPLIPGQSLALWTYPENALVEAGNAGAACLMVRRKVFEDIGVRHFHHMKMIEYPLLAAKLASMDDADEIERIVYETVMDADEYGEDMSFLLRAKHRGYRVFQHTGLKYGHAKSLLLTEEMYKDSQSREDTAPCQTTSPS